jgi:chemotaxis protein methyltransferase CheR
MIDLVTTNKTDFFREPAHFDFLKNNVLPEFINDYPNRPVKVWSAGCSSGEEPYTIAMVLNEFSERGRMLNYLITATDLSTQVLNKAIAAVYSEERVPGDFDLIFCRNVIIYFDKPTQEKVIEKLCAKIKSGGYFFLGHSESITGMNLPLQQLKPTIFRKI